MNSLVVRALFFIVVIVSGVSCATANQAPTLKPDSVSVAEGGRVVIDVLANDTAPEGEFNVGSMYISNEATNGYLSIDSRGRISYTHYGGATTADRFSYVIADDRGQIGAPAVVSIRIGDGSTDPATTSPSVNERSAGTATRKQSAGASAEPAITPPASAIVSGRLSAFHRSGQTFLTWQETADNDGYHVYRHNQPITEKNLSAAQRLTSRWGPLGNNTSVNVYGGERVPDHFVINDLAAPLADDAGLFVYTVQPGDTQRAYYAVTNVRGGRERSLMSLNAPLAESVDTPRDVLTVSTNKGKGRIYTQYMDYTRWNPTQSGYAYNYAIALPSNYNPKKEYPLLIELHAYYEQHKFETQAQYGWQVIQMFPSDPGPVVGAQHSWWFGYSTDHDYRNSDTGPSSGRIENFTEQRVMRAIRSVANNVSVDKERIYGSGNSMGASGLLALSMRYGSVITGVYANQPMTNYVQSQVFAEELVRLWGDKSRNLPVVNRGPDSESIQSVRAGVWDWMNHQQQLVARRGTDMGYLMTLHGKQDQVIEWQTQGKPWVKALNDANAGFSAVYDDVGHTWVGFSAVVNSLFGFGNDQEFPYKYPLSLSFPGIQRASGSGPIAPSASGRDAYNMNIEWATPHTRFAKSIVDTPTRYEVSIRSTAGQQTADITPRRLQQFSPRPGQQCQYQAAKGRNVVASGSVTADMDALITLRSIPIFPGAGTRIAVVCR